MAVGRRVVGLGLEHGDYYIGTAWWQWEELCQWKYHNDEYGLYWKVGSRFGGAGGGFDDSIVADIFDLPVYKHRWTKDPPPDPRHWALLCAFIFFSFSFPCPLLLARMFRRTAVASLGMAPEKCGFGQQGALCACAFFVPSWDCCSGAERTPKLDFGILSHHGAHSARPM